MIEKRKEALRCVSAAQGFFNTEKKNRGILSDVPVVREAGVEPARPCEHWHLKPASLPIPPLAQVVSRSSAQELYYHGDLCLSTLFFLLTKRFFPPIINKLHIAADVLELVDWLA